MPMNDKDTINKPDRTYSDGTPKVSGATIVNDEDEEKPFQPVTRTRTKKTKPGPTLGTECRFCWGKLADGPGSCLRYIGHSGAKAFGRACPLKTQYAGRFPRVGGFDSTTNEYLDARQELVCRVCMNRGHTEKLCPEDKNAAQAAVVANKKLIQTIRSELMQKFKHKPSNSVVRSQDDEKTESPTPTNPSNGGYKLVTTQSGTEPETYWVPSK